MIELRIEHVGVQKMSWLGTTDGLRTARTIVLVGDFANMVVDGKIPAGTPIATDFTAYAPGKRLAGFTVNDLPLHKITGAFNRAVALMDTGRVIVSKLPHAGFVAPSADDNASTVIFA